VSLCISQLTQEIFSDRKVFKLAHKKTLNFRSKKKDIRILSEIIWDAEVTNLDLERDKFAIIERALMYGREEHIRWVHKHYSLEDIASVVRLSSNLDARTANYWSIRLHIPREEVKCFSKSSAII
jgi:hypothetical protein